MKIKAVALALLLACLAGAGCSPNTAPPAEASPGPVSTLPTPTTAQRGAIRFADSDNFDVRDMPMRMALDALAEQGYEIETTFFESNSLIAEALARGDADIAWISTLTAWTAAAEGMEARTLMETAGLTSVLAVGTEITTCNDLAGKRLSGPSPTALVVKLAEIYIEQHCPGVETEYLLIGEPSGRTAALATGEIEAAVLQSEQLLKLQIQYPGKFHALFHFADEFPNVKLDGLHVRQAWASEHPEAVRGLVRALLKAHRLVAVEPGVLYAEAVKRLELDPDTARQLGEAYLKIDVWDANGGLTLDDVEYNLDFMKQYADLPASLKAEDVADLSFLEAVLDEIGRQ